MNTQSVFTTPITAPPKRPGIGLWTILLAWLALGASAGAQTVLTETQKLSPDFGACSQYGPYAGLTFCFDRQLGISAAVSGNTILAALTADGVTVEYEDMFGVLAFTRGSDGRW